MTPGGKSTFEVDQPWVVYHFGLTHDLWWPFWNSTRFLGRMKVICECAVCGDRTVLKLRIPRLGPVVEEGRADPLGRHPTRVAYLAAHAHPDRGAPMSWERPLLNPAAHEGGLDLDALAMRLEADINERPETP